LFFCSLDGGGRGKPVLFNKKLRKVLHPSFMVASAWCQADGRRSHNLRWTPCCPPLGSPHPMLSWA
jgi:hypothetical protein